MVLCRKQNNQDRVGVPAPSLSKKPGQDETCLVCSNMKDIQEAIRGKGREGGCFLTLTKSPLEKGGHRNSDSEAAPKGHSTHEKNTQAKVLSNPLTKTVTSASNQVPERRRARDSRARVSFNGQCL